MPDILSLIGMIGAFILILGGAYFVTKWIGKKGSYHSGYSKNIKVIDRLPLGAERQVFIIESAGKTMLIGVTPQHIEKICDLDPEKIILDNPAQTAKFSDIMKETLKNQWGISKGKGKKGKDKPDE